MQVDRSSGGTREQQLANARRGSRGAAAAGALVGAFWEPANRQQGAVAGGVAAVGAVALLGVTAMVVKQPRKLLWY
jgi:hypothetical protein